MVKLRNLFVTAIILAVVSVSGFAIPSIDTLLENKINASPSTLTPVVITFERKPTSTEFQMLRS